MPASRTSRHASFGSGVKDALHAEKGALGPYAWQTRIRKDRSSIHSIIL